MRLTSGWKISMAFVLLLAGGHAVSAVPILSGQAEFTPGDGTLPAGAQFVTSVTNSFTGENASDVVVFTGTVESLVYSDPSTGYLDFVYQITNNSSFSDADSIERLTVASFAGFTTDADYIPSTGDVPSFDASRDSTGAVMGFDMNNGGVAPGQDSDDLIIDTDSKTFTMSGNAAVIDGGTGNAQVDVPLAATQVSAVPEPASLSLLAIAAGFFGGRRRKR